MSNKSAIGRPTRYTTQSPACVREYTQKCVKSDKFPTVEGLAQYLKVGVRTIYGWDNVHREFSQTMETLRDTQKQLLITKGLSGAYNSRFAMFLLKANHGMSEKETVQDNTLNYFTGVSPDLLADALKIMHKSGDTK